VQGLAAAGAAQVVVVNRNPERAEAAAALAGPVGAVGTPATLVDADLVVNATPLGMGGTPHADDVPFDVHALRSDCVVSDLIYQPAETTLLASARARGLRCQNGLPMLVHQAVAQFEHWTGVDAPVAEMAAAVRRSLP
jgi:shikimate dehydrogenase